MTLKGRKEEASLNPHAQPAPWKVNFGLFRPNMQDALVVLLSRESFGPGVFAIQVLVSEKKEACSTRGGNGKEV